MTPTLSVPSAQDTDACWDAYAAHDARADGTFVVAIRTTGIYCRPSCPARRARPENVLFLTAPADAEAQGFRACLRCRPQEAAPQAQMAARLCALIEAHADKPLSLAQLGREANLSAAHAQRVFVKCMGVSPRQYADALRMRRFKSGLRDGQPITEAIFDAGYGSTSRVYERTPERLGMTPSAYRKGGAGREIAFTTVPCALGWLLVAATETGLCAVSLGDSPDVLEDGLRREFPAARLTEDMGALAQWAQPLLAALEGAGVNPSLPLDIQGTAFEARVWDALRAIPVGETRSYGAIAAQLGQPGGARAVARACAANKVALAVPCHRVVREGGALSGYRWGPERKRVLLERERQAAQNG